MEYTINKCENGLIKVSFVVETDEWKGDITSAYLKTKHKYKVGGFRQGKATQTMIERQYGESIFWEDALDIAIERGYGNLLDEHKEIVPVVRPDVAIDSVSREKAEFTISIQQMPDIEISKYTGLNVEVVKPQEVTDQMVEAKVNQDRNRLSSWTPVTDRPAQMGDKTNIDYQGLKDDVAFEGGTAQNQELELGSGSFIPGFEDGVVGMNIGDEKDIPLTFPEDYHAKELAGAKVIFKVKLNSIDAKDMPELDDEFAKDMGFDTYDEYSQSIRKDLETSAEERAKQETENAVLEAVLANATVTIPQSIIEKRAKDLVDDFAKRLEMQGMSIDMYYKYTGQTEKQMVDSYLGQAEKSVKTELTINKVGELAEIKYSQVEYDKIMDSLYKTYNQDQAKSMDEFKEEIFKMSGTKEYVEDRALTETIINYLIEQNTAK